MARKTTRNIYLFVMAVFGLTSFIAIAQGCYGIVTSEVTALIFGSFIVSLIFFVGSKRLFEKFEANSDGKSNFKVLGYVLYFFSLPAPLLIVFANIAAIMAGPPHWAFG